MFLNDRFIEPASWQTWLGTEVAEQHEANPHRVARILAEQALLAYPFKHQALVPPAVAAEGALAIAERRLSTAPVDADRAALLNGVKHYLAKILGLANHEGGES
jgi:hypothetical protein